MLLTQNRYFFYFELLSIKIHDFDVLLDVSLSKNDLIKVIKKLLSLK